jgi:cysteine desulfurase/selenocysteine lyase
MTADDRSFAPPHEVAGQIGQLGDAGGGVVPGLPRAPLPGALATVTPGITPSGMAPPAPMSGPDDPRMIALAIAQIAGQLFQGAPGAAQSPVPTAPAGVLTPSHVQLMGSPGVGPSFVPGPPLPGITPAPAAPGSPAAPAQPAAQPFTGDPSDAAISQLAAEMFGAHSIGVEILRLPVLDSPAADAAPYLPAQPTPAPAISSPEAPRAEQPAIRDLGGTGFDPHAVRRDFPILEERIHGGKRLVWLDNAATTQKPRQVIDRLSYFYTHENSNVHRGAHTLAARSTDAYEGGRESTRKFLNASSTSEIVFVRGATEGINLIAQSWGRRHIAAGDEIVITNLEHHANIVPWQMLCQATGARLRVAPVDDRGDIILDAYERLLGSRTKLVAFPQVSNALGTVTPAREMIEIAHRHGALVLLDGAQAVSHMRVDVQALDADFYVLSGHKVFAPTGIGAVYGKRALLEAMPPWQGGGNMIQDVTFEHTTYQAPPWRFEAGTGSIADAVGLGAALDYVMRIGMDTIARYEHELLVYADRKLATVPGLKMIGAPREKAGVLSFVLDGQRTEAVGGILDQEGIAVRSGHHCAQPILRRFGVEASVRASLALYNTYEDIDDLVAALCRLQANRGTPPR